jgi:Tol biopolymer transport system component
MMSTRLPSRVAAACIAASGVLLASCEPPTKPGNVVPPPPPGPTVQRSTGPIGFVSNRDGTDAIYVANEDGSAVTKLAAGFGPAWSRNGPQIAFWSNWRIYVINVDGSRLRFVIDGTYPAWSPDGGSLVFSSIRDDSEIDAVNLDGSARRSLFDSGGFGSFGPQWSPDGQWIVFSIGTFSNWCFGLWTVNADGSDARQLGGPGVGRPSSRCDWAVEASLTDAYDAVWSPTGSEIAFTGDHGIEVVRADGSGRHLRVPGPAFDPDWTPDGRLIYTKGPHGPNDGPTRIFISDGGTERQLIPDAIAPARSVYRDSMAVWLR